MWTRQDIDELYRRHGFTVLRRCRRLLGNEEEAKDMVQEVFVKALENPGLFQGRSAASTFLYGMATNLCLNRIRNSAARSEAWQSALAALMESRATDLAEELGFKELASLVLSEADEISAAIGLYHWVDGLSQGEVAQLVGLSRVTVNQRLAKLRAAAQALREGS